MDSATDKVFLTETGSKKGQLLWSPNRISDSDKSYTNDEIRDQEKEKAEADLLLLAETIAHMHSILSTYRFVAGEVFTPKESRKQSATLQKGTFKALRLISKIPKLKKQSELMCKDIGCMPLKS